MAPSDLLVEGGPGGVFVVVRVRLEAALEDADESVRELSQRGVVWSLPGRGSWS